MTLAMPIILHTEKTYEHSQQDTRQHWVLVDFLGFNEIKYLRFLNAAV